MIVKAKNFQKHNKKSEENSLKINVAKMKKIIRKCSNFLRKFKTILNSKKFEKLSFHEFYDHKIELIDDFSTLSKIRVYSLTLKKWKTLKKYLSKNLNKKFINFNKVEKIVFIFFAIKLNDQLRFCVDYRKLNVITKRNEYFILLIKKTLTRIMSCKHISKLNIIATFNKLRMNSINEELITFIIVLRTYKYHVMSFDLTRDLVNWQNYMNDLLFDFLNKFCQMYMNDILIYNKIRKKHRQHLK